MKNKVFDSIFVTVLVALLASCSNDSIEVDRQLTLRVTPSGVVKPFNYEYGDGDNEGLTKLNADYRLRTRLLVYNTEGKAVEKRTYYLKDYKDEMVIKSSLPNGTYQMVAITDVVAGEDYNYEFWILSDEDELGKMKITSVKNAQNGSAQNGPGYKNCILGIDSRQVQITSESREVELTPKPAGALLCVRIKDVKKFANIKLIQFRTNQMSHYISFNTKGAFTTKTEGCDISLQDGIRNQWNTSSVTRRDVACYLFFLPTDIITMAFAYGLVGETKGHYATEKIDKSLEAGAEYEMLLDLTATSESDLSNGKAAFKFNKVSK